MPGQLPTCAGSWAEVKRAGRGQQGPEPSENDVALGAAAAGGGRRPDLGCQWAGVAAVVTAIEEPGFPKGLLSSHVACREKLVPDRWPPHWPAQHQEEAAAASAHARLCGWPHPRGHIIAHASVSSCVL